MKKILFLVLICTTGNLLAQNQAKDTARYDYVAAAIDSTLFNQKVEYINELFDINGIIDKILIKSDDKYVKDFNYGFRNGLMRKFNFGQKMLQAIGKDGNFDFLRSKINSKGEYHLLFRMSGEIGLNYVEFKMDEIEGKPMIVDVYYYMSGEYITKTLSDIYKAGLSAKPSVLEKLFKTSIIDDFRKLKRARDLATEGKLNEAFNVYQAISSEGKKQKSILLFGMQIASEINDEDYKKIIQQYEEMFPNDPSLYLISIDGAYMNENYDRVLNLIRKLESAVGGDPYLNSLRTNVYYAKGDLKNALKHGHLMIDYYPLSAESYTSLMTIYIELKDYNEAVRVLDRFVKAFGVTREDIKQGMIEDYPEFVKTEEYKFWLNQK